MAAAAADPGHAGGNGDDDDEEPEFSLVSGGAYLSARHGPAGTVAGLGARRASLALTPAGLARVGD